MTKITFVKALFTGASLFFLNTINAQLPQWEWAKRSGGNVTAMAKDNSGNIYHSGIFYADEVTFGSITLTNNGPGGDNQTRDGFFAKYDSNGNVLWAKKIGGPQHDEVYTVATDAEGNVYVGGSFSSATLTFDDITLTNTDSSTNDMFIVKFDSNGSAIWAINAAGAGYDYIRTLAIDATGNVYAAGTFTSPAFSLSEDITLNNTHPTITHDVFIAKYNSEGVALWAKSAGADMYNDSRRILIDNNENVYFLGYYYSGAITFEDTTLVNTNEYGDIFLVKYDTDGNQAWAKRYGGNNYDYPTSIISDNNGHLYLGGHYQSTTLTLGTTTLTNSGTYSDIFLAKLDENGDAIWAKTASGDRGDQINQVLLDANGDIYAIGSFSTFGLDGESITFPGMETINSAGEGDIFIAKYDADGNLLGVKTTGGTGHDLALAGCITNGTYLYISGNSDSSTISFDGTTIQQTGFENAYVAKIDLGILDTPQFAAQNYGVYPNPATTVLNIRTDKPVNNYSIYDITGRVVNGGKLNNDSIINISNLPSGLYILSCDNGINTKFVKE